MRETAAPAPTALASTCCWASASSVRPALRSAEATDVSTGVCLPSQSRRNVWASCPSQPAL
jgi:hypothetical protein